MIQVVQRMPLVAVSNDRMKVNSVSLVELGYEAPSELASVTVSTMNGLHVLEDVIWKQLQLRSAARMVSLWELW